MLIKKIITLSAVICALLYPVAASADETASPTIGEIIEIEGSAYILHDGKSSPAATDMPVHIGDMVQTALGGRTHILFADNTEVTLGENASVKIDEYLFDNPLGGGHAVFSFVQGAFWFISGLITKTDKPDVRLETPYGSIGLRGTSLWAGPIDDKYNVFVEEGKVAFTTPDGETLINAGEGTGVALKNQMTAAADIPAQKKSLIDEIFSSRSNSKSGASAPLPAASALSLESAKTAEVATHPPVAAQWTPDMIGKARETVTLKRADAVRKIVAERKLKNAERLQKR